MYNVTLNGFEVFEDLLPGIKTNKDDMLDGITEPLTDEELDAIKNKKDDKDPDNIDDPDKDDIDDTDDIDDPKDTKDKKDKKDTTKPNNNVKESDNEPDDTDDDKDNAVSAFFGVMADKFGWEIGEDEEIPSTPEELVDYFSQVIEENSVPQYASEEVEKLDEFVRNGGNLKDYFLIDADIDLENIDITDDEANLKAVIREYLKEKGVSSKQIDKKLTKYEDAGLLEDEAEDALEALKEIKEQKKQQLLEDQQKLAENNKKRQQAYFNSVVEEIKGMDNVRGIKIPEKDKKVLLEYIFKPDANGVTSFQRDWSKSVRNLLESAYFTMKGDLLIKAAKTEGSNKAIDKFKNSLNNTGVSRKTKKLDTTSSESMWDSFARQIRKF